MAINRLTRRGPVQGVEPEMLEQGRGDRPRRWRNWCGRRGRRRDVTRGLERLKPLDRATLEAFYIRGRTLKQMSREFETPIGTIKRRLHVARLRLKDVLEAPAGETMRRRRFKRRMELAAV